MSLCAYNYGGSRVQGESVAKRRRTDRRAFGSFGGEKKKCLVKVLAHANGGFKVGGWGEVERRVLDSAVTAALETCRAKERKWVYRVHGNSLRREDGLRMRKTFRFLPPLRLRANARRPGRNGRDRGGQRRNRYIFYFNVRRVRVGPARRQKEARMDSRKFLENPMFARKMMMISGDDDDPMMEECSAAQPIIRCRSFLDEYVFVLQ